MTSKIYQLNSQRIKISYRIVSSSLGYILIANNDRGICSINLGDSPENLIFSLAEEFTQATITQEDSSYQDYQEQILSYIAGKKFNLEFPLALQGTLFQQQVWQSLQRIPYGETRTYGEIASDLGKPTASRPVGNACSANPIALIIPCHRVIRSDRSLGNYRWGIERKQKLIELETKQKNLRP